MTDNINLEEVKQQALTKLKEGHKVKFGFFTEENKSEAELLNEFENMIKNFQINNNLSNLNLENIQYSTHSNYKSIKGYVFL